MKKREKQDSFRNAIEGRLFFALCYCMISKRERAKSIYLERMIDYVTLPSPRFLKTEILLRAAIGRL